MSSIRMSGDIMASGSLVAADYAVFVLVLIVSAVIGIYYAWVSRGQENPDDFLTGGRKLTAFPVAMSLLASFMSSTTLLANPAEVYIYGTILIFFYVAYVLSIVVSSETFLPVFYRLSLTSVFQYLERRFNKTTCLVANMFFMIQVILYAGLIIYGPALALSQVTHLNLWTGILSTGAVCTFYCTLGGLKAVVWTDVFQIVIMLAGYLCVIIRCLILQGGVDQVISDAQEGGRINILDFDINPLRRHTFWTISIGATFTWISVYGVNQGQVQRYNSCKTITHARTALYINIVGLCVFLTCSVFAGMCLYSYYKDCDPWTLGLISTPDQLMPHLVMNILTDYPGLPGLFLAAVFSGSLSSVSSVINAIAAVTVEDVLRPHTNMSEKQLTWASKGLSCLSGLVCIAMAGAASRMGRMMEATIVISAVLGGPILGLFSLGIFCPFANSKGSLSGMIVGVLTCVGLGIGAMIFPPPPEMTRPLPLTTSGCNFTSDFSSSWTTTTGLPAVLNTIITTPTPYTDESSDGILFPSYLYLSPIGVATTVILGSIISLLTGGSKETVDPRLMFMKEDTNVYHIFKFFRDRVSGKTGRLDTKDGEEECSKTMLSVQNSEIAMTSRIDNKML